MLLALRRWLCCLICAEKTLAALLLGGESSLYILRVLTPALVFYCWIFWIEVSDALPLGIALSTQVLQL
jgi:hypothetical protein